MIRIAAAALMLASGAMAVLAQGDVIAERKKTMKANGAATEAGAAMAKGQAPFDLAKAQGIFRTYQEAARTMPGLFPENSKTGGDTSAAPRIWEDMAGFRAGFAKFEKEAAEAAAATKDLASFRAGFAIVTKNCGACHEKYRIKKS
ncbi:cytochrome c [Chelatococcus sp. SYSU_G07232]|uniref:Cytochrome c n=1 Tax=Chelatococcus albus TaxID=3047466 RepID=A0ABT7AGQ2_9HYPH|nr:cytochrome c [Chelatococcus sp. SYSU_G07232]MDJ1158513.1 cytochrome c [Chelatococcus sp. SYSU_G07232]